MVLIFNLSWIFWVVRSGMAMFFFSKREFPLTLISERRKNLIYVLSHVKMSWNLSVMFFLYHFIHIIVEWSWLFNSLKAVLNSFRKSLKNLHRKSLKKSPTEKVGDKGEAGNFEMMKMNIRRRLEEVSTGF